MSRGSIVALALCCSWVLSACSAIILATGTSEEDIIFEGATVQSLNTKLGHPLRVEKIEPPNPIAEVIRKERSAISLVHERWTQGADGQSDMAPPSVLANRRHYYKFVGRLRRQHDVGEAVSLNFMTFGLGELLMTPIAVRARAVARDHLLVVWLDDSDRAIAYRWAEWEALPWQ